MRPVTAWSHMMSTTVRVAARTGLDGYGKPTYGTDRTYRAHIARKRTFVRNQTGEVVESGQAVYLMTGDAIQPTARLTLSTGDVGSTGATETQPNILSVERRSDQKAAHHTVLFLG